MNKITHNSAVSFHYRLTDEHGTLLDASDNQPLVYLHGHHNIIVGLEKALEGKSVGDEFSVTVEPSEAYGEYYPEAVQQIPREYFQGVDKIEVGMQFQSQNEHGQPMLVQVAAVDDKTVTVDANHPLAGKSLTFAVKIVDIREASAEEIAHGHIHGVGGHHH